jgi:hypothetical protein
VTGAGWPLSVVHVTNAPVIAERLWSLFILKKMKAETEISSNGILFDDSGTITHKLFERTGVKADWLTDDRDPEL